MHHTKVPGMLGKEERHRPVDHAHAPLHWFRPDSTERPTSSVQVQPARHFGNDLGQLGRYLVRPPECQTPLGSWLTGQASFADSTVSHRR